MRVKVLNVETQSEVREISLEDSTARTGECLIGRSPDLGLVLESPDVSRLHGKFVNQDGQYTYYDLGSANGSLVNGKLAIANQPYPLKANDIVRIGEFTLMLREVQPMPEDLPATVMGGAEATVVGNSWQFLSNLPGFSSLVTEESSPSTPTVTPEPVLPTPIEEMGLTEAATPAPVTSETVDQGLMDALAAISETTDSVDTAGSEAEIVDHTTTWGTPSSPVLEVEEPVAEVPVVEAAIGEEPVVEVPVVETPEVEAPIAESTTAELTPETVDEPTPELTTAEVVPQFPEAAIATPDSTVIQADDLWDSATPQTESEPTVVQAADELAFADDATVVQPADLIESTVEPTVDQSPAEMTEATAEETSESVDAHFSEEPPPPEVLASEPTVVQAAEIVSAAFSTSDATVYQEEIADISEVPAADALAQDVWSTPANDTVPPPVSDSVTESIAEPVTESIPDSVVESVGEPVVESDFETTVVPVAEPVTDPPSEVEVVTAVDDSVSQPPIAEVQPAQPFGDRYIALLCHDSQLSEMKQFVERHRSFLSQCLTISTPPISQALSAIGLEVSQQTPAVPPGGYQTVNSLVTSDKVLAVIFLRDFFTPQPTQANDEALTRSCNVHQVMLANNLPTAEAIAHYLENVMTGAVTL